MSIWTVLYFKWIRIENGLYVKQNYKKTIMRKMELFVRIVIFERKKNSKINLIQNEITTSCQQLKLNSLKYFKRTPFVGPSFPGKTYLMLKILSRIQPDRDLDIITKSHPEQY